MWLDQGLKNPLKSRLGTGYPVFVVLFDFETLRTTLSVTGGFPVRDEVEARPPSMVRETARGPRA